MLLQTADSFRHSAKVQHWRSAGLTGLVCTEGGYPQKVVSGILALAILSQTLSVSAHPTLMLELILQYKCRLSLKYSVSVYSIILEQWLSVRSPRLPTGRRGTF